jgi:hypothetical protein
MKFPITTRRVVVTLLLLPILSMVAFTRPRLPVLVEAEAFRTLGGWVIDQQFEDQMGSPFLLAHGLGTPVVDAKTEVPPPRAGLYRVWVRTRDWVARWKVAGAPGRFQLLVNGVPLKTIFGTEGADWHWQNGGTVRLPARKIELALHDLTGFDGRCDAVIFAPDLKWMPPEGRQLAALRKEVLRLADQPDDAGKFDLVVVGGGMAGISAAVAAARLGLQIALIQDRPVLGGNSSSEVRVYPGGRTMLGRYPGLGAVEHELDPGSSPGIDKSDESGNARDARLYADEKKLYVVRSEKNIHLFLNVHAVAVQKFGTRIVAVIGREVRTGRDLRFAAPLFADCTGDGTIGFLAGADYRVGREGKDETGEELAPDKGDKQVMGSTYMWYAKESDTPVSFPEVPWAVEFNERTAQRGTRGDWDWEVGMLQDQIADGETIRDYAYRAIYGNWSFLKNHAENRAAYARQRLSWVAYVAGKRESRRLLGDVILKQQDLQKQVEFPDGSVMATWGIDLHYPAPQNATDFPDGEFRSIYRSEQHQPFAIPYRCFYSRNIENLFMAGRDISVTHVMLGTVRVQRTTAMMGEVVGMAASVCMKRGSTPRGVYQNYLGDLKSVMTKGVGRDNELLVAARLPVGFSKTGEWQRGEVGLRSSSDGATANWKPDIRSRAVVRIWLQLVQDPHGDRAATVDVFHNGFLAVRYVNLAEEKTRWLDLGRFQFTGNPIDCVRLVQHTPGAVVTAASVRFEVLRGDGNTVRSTVVIEPQ